MRLPDTDTHTSVINKAIPGEVPVFVRILPPDCPYSPASFGPMHLSARTCTTTANPSQGGDANPWDPTGSARPPKRGAAMIIDTTADHRSSIESTLHTAHARVGATHRSRGARRRTAVRVAAIAMSVLMAGTATAQTAEAAVPGSVQVGTVGTAAASSAAIESYVSAVYRDLFGRSPDPSGLRTWTNALLTGTPRVAVANSITSSAEYRLSLIHISEP